MQHPNQSEPTSKIPWYQTPEGKAYQKAYEQSPEAKAKRKARQQTPEYKAYQKAYRRSPEAKAKRKARQQTPEYKAKQKAHEQSPEGKAKQKAYRQSPKYKAYQKAYEQSPEYKAKKKAYKQSPEYKARQKAYREQPEIKSRYEARQAAYQEQPEIKSLIRARSKAWRKNNPERMKVLNKASHEKRLKEDPLYAATIKLRSAVHNAFYRIGKNKPTDTQTLLGCSWEEAKAHIESLFKEGMSWENHGEWHIDHIIPVAYFRQIQNLDSMNHISNLQPLWAEENIEKSDTVFLD
jgi:hypothetical protein